MSEHRRAIGDHKAGRKAFDTLVRLFAYKQVCGHRFGQAAMRDPFEVGQRGLDIACRLGIALRDVFQPAAQ